MFAESGYAESRPTTCRRRAREKQNHTGFPGNRLLTFWLLTGVLMLAGCGEHAPPTEVVTPPQPPAGTIPATPRGVQPSDWFRDMTTDSGVDFQYRNGRDGQRFTILESVGGGVAMLDYDRDGQLDLFFPGGGTIDAETGEPSGLPGVLYRNEGNWQFRDVTAAAGLTTGETYTHGGTVGDFDNDGWPDLLVTGYGRSRLFHNEGDGTFTDVTQAAGLPENAWHTAAAWADLDRDGGADLLLIAYVDWKPGESPGCRRSPSQELDTCPPQKYNPLPDRSYRNRGDGTFEENTAQIGLKPDGKGLGVVATDMNADGRVDVYVANDQIANFLYLSQPDGTWQEQGYLAGVAGNEYGIPEGSMGVDLADVDGDGLAELFVTNYEMEDNSLYRGLGNGLFEHQTVRFGLGGKSRQLVGFGTALEDFNGDARPDLLVINGHVLYTTGLAPLQQRAALYRNEAGKRFEEVTDDGGPWFAEPRAGRGLAVGDLDNNGSPDLAVSSLNEPVSLLKNNKTPGRWIRLEPVGTTVERRAVGAVLAVEWNDHRVTRFVTSGAGYLSSFDSRILIALPEADHNTLVRVRVKWDTEHEQVFEELAPNRTHQLIQGSRAE